MKINPIIFQEIESECRAIVNDFLTNDKEFIVQSFKSFISNNTEAKTCAIFWNKNKFKKLKDDSFFDKYLGNYEHHENGQFEGHINIYPANILSLVKESKFSHKLSSEYKQMQFFKSVCRVMLLHELSHWLIHFVRVGGVHINHYNENFIKMSTYQHEQLAQICTSSMLKKKIDNYTFGYLMEISSEEYQLEPELICAEPSQILSVIKDFRYPIYYKCIPDEKPFSKVFESLLNEKIKPI